MNRQTEHYHRMREQGFSRRNIWLDDEALGYLQDLVGRYGKNYSEVIAEALHCLHQQAKKERRL